MGRSGKHSGPAGTFIPGETIVKKVRCIAFLVLAAAAGALAQVSDAENPYVRKPKTAAVSGEFGFNSLASIIGVKGTYFVTPQVLLDAGLGLSEAGLRPGLYARYLFSKAKFTPFVYGGLKVGLGSYGKAETVTDYAADSSGADVDYQLITYAIPYVDYGLGLDYLADGGFTFSMGIGWSESLRDNDHKWVGTQPPAEFNRTIGFGLASGLAFYLSFGGAF
jgi:hypothetical protein